MTAPRKTNTYLDKIAAEKLAVIRMGRSRSFTELPLLDFVPAVTPLFHRPTHLAPIAEVLDRVFKGPEKFTFSAPPRHGKDICDTTPMLTRDRGWVPASEIVVGDQIYGSNGEFTKVLEVFPQGEKPQFRVTFSDHASLVVGAGHLWSVRQRYYDKWYTKTTEELMGDLRESDDRKKWQIPMVRPVEGTDTQFLIDPYLLGVWLGDGTTAKGAITTMDLEIRDHFASHYELSDVVYDNGGRALTYNSVPFKHHLKELGVLGNKHVPQSYLTASAADRLALLQGLNDTDGTVARNGSQQSFCSTLPALRDAFCELVSSLGGTFTVVEKPTYRKLAYNVYFRLPDGMPGFRLARKQNKLAGPSSRNRPRRFIDAIEPVGVRSSRCFMVAAEDHLFCAGKDYVVTHNSELIFHFIAKFLAAFPEKTVAYVTYTSTLAEKRNLQIREICKRAGVAFDKTYASRADWKTSAGGGVIARGPSGALTGEGIHLMVVDDPYRDRVEAASAVMRETLMDWWSDVVRSRIEPGGSVIVFHTRWMEDDLIGTLISEHQWPHINLKALQDDGTALWPVRYGVEHFQELRTENAYTFASLYQGEPRPKGGAVFSGTFLYTEAQFKTLVEEKRIVKYVIGIDMAYTAKSYSDYSVAVVMAVDKDGDHYVVDVRRNQKDAPSFAGILKELRLQYNFPIIYWYTGGIEKLVVETFRNSFGIPIKAVNARTDKFERATAVASAWNAGRIRIPKEHRVWGDSFSGEILTFTGISDKHDDQVDALAAAFIPSAGRKIVRGSLPKQILSF
jgi:predicted phage terminase large subunit-like protein